MTSLLEQAYEKSLDCVHCGLCLATCPTYETLASEPDSPRGRILIMRALTAGRIYIDDENLAPPLDRCLDCRACETACPSGVAYGQILENVREELGAHRGRSFKQKSLRLALDALLVKKPLHRIAVTGLALLQSLGFAHVLRLLRGPVWMRKSFELLPEIPSSPDRRPITPGTYEPGGKVRAEVGLFTGCLMETVFGRVNRAILELLLSSGCRVHVPEGQACCGALHVHSGFREEARPLALRNAQAFALPLDAVIQGSAGCGSTMKEYGQWLPEAAGFASKVKDICEFLDELGNFTPKRALVRRVVYDDPCHLYHGQGVHDAPRKLLGSIPGLRLIPLPHSEDCCGSAGVYNLVQTELSDQILARKMDEIECISPDTVITANPGCHMQLQMGLRRRGLDARVQHVAELLAESIASD